MLENSFGLIFFLNAARHWNTKRWNKKTERATGPKEDARSLNFFLDSLTAKIHEIKAEIMYVGKPVTSQRINHWILSERQKTNSTARIPLLPKVIEILEKHKDHTLCLKRGTVLPVSSNQKMNE